MPARRNSILHFRLLLPTHLAMFAAASSMLFCGQVEAQSQRPRASEFERREIVRTASVHWENVPLRDAIERLSRAFEAAVVVDRRLDPTQRIRLQVKDAALENILQRLAVENGWHALRFGSTHYLGPAAAADRLLNIAALRRNDASALPVAQRQAWDESRSIDWPRLTSPRDLIVAAIGERGWQVRGEASIPHDLWPAGRLTDLALADQLSLLLIGFDLTFRIEPGQRVVEIVALDEQVKENGTAAQTREPPAPAAEVPIVRNRPRSARSRADVKQVYTLRVEEQPVGVVLHQLADRLGWQLAIDDAAIQAAGSSLDRRVSFSVQNADEDQLLEALLTPAELTFEHESEQLKIIPAAAAKNRN